MELIMKHILVVNPVGNTKVTKKSIKVYFAQVV
jgi:hypothetical protein